MTYSVNIDPMGHSEQQASVRAPSCGSEETWQGGQFPLRIFNKGFKTVIYKVKKIKMYLSNPHNYKKIEQAMPDLLDPLQQWDKRCQVLGLAAVTLHVMA